jgi:cytidylate kinase
VRKKDSFFVLMFIGPSGVGKSTISERFSQHTGLPVVDIGYDIFRRRAYLEDHPGSVPTPEILRSDAVSKRTQELANNPDRSWWNARAAEVRARADKLNWHLIANGRDPEILLPHITQIIEIKADRAVCEARRAAQLGHSYSHTTGTDMAERDAADKARAMELPDGRIIIDTTYRTVDDSFQEILRLLTERDIVLPKPAAASIAAE